MNASHTILHRLRGRPITGLASQCVKSSKASAPPAPRRLFTTTRWRRQEKPLAEDPSFVSILDRPPQLVRVNRRKHGIGLFFLAIIPATAFALGTWQVQRLQWKTDLIARLEDRLIREPLPLPRSINPEAIPDFDFRRILARGVFRHDQEMLVGPRMRDGQDGYLVITPLERQGASTVLVNRGWISKKKKDQRSRPDGLPTGEIVVEGLLREPWKKNMFTPDNRPERGDFFFPDVEQMARLTNSQPVWVEATMELEFMQMVDFERRGIPFGRPAEINLRNNHAQYIFTWYGLAVATSIMLYMVAKKPSTNIARRLAAARA